MMKTDISPIKFAISQNVAQRQKLAKHKPAEDKGKLAMLQSVVGNVAMVSL